MAVSELVTPPAKPARTRKAPARKPGEPLGMPAARPFSTEGAGQIFVIQYEDIIESYLFSAERVQRAGIHRGKYTSFDGIYVFGFNEAELKLLLKGLDAFVSERYGTRSSNVERVKIRPRSELLSVTKKAVRTKGALPYPIQVSGTWRGEQHGDTLYILSGILGPVLKKKILLSTPQGTYRTYDERAGFQVHIWSTPHTDERLERYPPRQIWDQSASTRHQAFDPVMSAQGILIKDGDFIVAELLPNALYITYNLLGDSSVSSRHILIRLCRTVAQILGDEKGLAAAFEAARADWRVRQLELYSRIVEKSIPARAHRDENAIEAAREAASEAREVWFEAERTLFGLEQAASDPVEASRRFSMEIEKLRSGRVALVEDVIVGGSVRQPTLKIHTKEILAHNSRTREMHMLGRYELVFHLETGGVLFLNRDRTVGGYHGPHIDGNGAACLGTISRDLRDYIAHYEIEAATALAIAFLQNPNMDDAQGRVVSQFPIATTPNQ